MNQTHQIKSWRAMFTILTVMIMMSLLCVHCPAHSECDSDMVSSSTLRNGTVTSPHYPSVYPADIQCHITLRPRPSERVQLVFVDFDLNYPIGNPRDPHE